MSQNNDDEFALPDELAKEVKQVQERQLSGQALTAAMMSMDNDVELPGRQRPASAISNLLALDVGDNFTRSFAVPANLTLNDVQEKMTGWKESLRQSLNQSIRHARKHGDRKYSMESLHTVTPSGGIYLQVIVTRTN